MSKGPPDRSGRPLYRESTLLKRLRLSGPLDLLDLDRYRRSFDNQAGRNTPGTHTYPPTLTTLVDDLDRLKVWQPTATCLVMRVTDIVAGRGTLFAYVAHSSHLFIPALFESLTCLTQFPPAAPSEPSSASPSPRMMSTRSASM